MKQDKTRIISGKDLGQLALTNFCPRCFWLERKLGKSPSIFPGIFSTIDSLTKKSVKRCFDETNRGPDWLPFKDLKQPLDLPRISVPMFEYGDWVLTGDPDDVFELKDGSYHIVDYKTAKFTSRQDELLPMYEVQLNAYALGLSVYKIQPISRLSLIYCEPKQELESDNDFCLGFTIRTLDIDIRPQIIPELLRQAREILKPETPPEPRSKCKGICHWLDTSAKQVFGL